MNGVSSFISSGRRVPLMAAQVDTKTVRRPPERLAASSTWRVPSMTTVRMIGERIWSHELMLAR